MILLSSLSLRRKELLQQIGFEANTDFIQIDSPVDFDFHKQKQRLTLEEIQRMVVSVAQDKVNHALNIGRYLETRGLQPRQTIVVGMDTVAFFNGRVFDRPTPVNLDEITPELIKQAEEKAWQILSTLKGQEIYFITGMVVAPGEDYELHQMLSCSVTSSVRMKSFSDEDIKRYIESREPLDKAGAIGIQARGVALIESIKGSYSNVVGLPVFEFVELLRNPLFYGRVQLPLTTLRPSTQFPETKLKPELGVIAVGDINYDLTFNDLPADFFHTLNPPGVHLRGELQQGVGGTAVVFARAAYAAGFKHCSILGVIGGKGLGALVQQELSDMQIRPLLPANYRDYPGIALVLRDRAPLDTSLTITSPQPGISEDAINKEWFKPEQGVHVVFISGYGLADHNRQRAVLKVIDYAHEANQIVVLDANVGMEEAFTFDRFVELTRGEGTVLVAEISTILKWFHLHEIPEHAWDTLQTQVLPELRKHFQVIFLRTSTYSHEMIVTPDRLYGPNELDYSRRPAQERLGYADEITARHLFRFMSPRVLLASSSPRRLMLLRQIVADTKIEVMPSDNAEELQTDESPTERVKRLALEKARSVLARREEFSPSIEIVIGADTEIVLNGKVAGHPAYGDSKAARQILRNLSGRIHEAITGLALIQIETKTEIVETVSTLVKFKELSESEIDLYISSGECFGKAGAYGIQGLGALFVEWIEGSYSNVIGLPLERLTSILNESFDRPIWNIDKVSCWNF